MSATWVLEDEVDGVVVLTLNRPDARNALNRPTLDQLGEKLDAIAIRRDVRAVIFAGNEKAFCAGADLKERKGMTP